MEKLREPVEKYYIRVNTLETSRSRLMNILRKEGLKPKRSPHLKEGIYFEREGPNFLDDYAPGLPVIRANKFAAESVYQGVMLYVPGVLESDHVEIEKPKSRTNMGIAVN